MQGPRLLFQRTERLLAVHRARRGSDGARRVEHDRIEADSQIRLDTLEQQQLRMVDEEIDKGGGRQGHTAKPQEGGPTVTDTMLPDGSDKSKEQRSRLRRTMDWGSRHLRFLGPGLIASAAYIDPGNYATDLSAGATFGYKLLSIVLISGLIGILMQILATRLGVVSGKDIAQLCRESLHSRESHTMLWRWGLLYPLYFIAEAGIVFTDLAELLGTATAFHLLIPQIPLWGGVLLTSLDVFIILIAFNQYPSEKRDRSIVAFEILIGVLVMTVLASFVVLIVRLAPRWADVFNGYIPSSTIVSGGALYISVGIIGATVMPHALFLGAKIATIQRVDVDEDKEEDVKAEGPDASVDLATRLSANPLAGLSSHIEAQKSSPRTSPAVGRVRSRSQPQSFGPSLHMPQPTPMPSLPFPPPSEGARSVKLIRTHLHHAQIDIATSLFCFALVVNSAILIVASAAFYYGEGIGDTTGVQEGNLFSAFDLIKQRLGQAFAYLFALALMMSGQAASITATLAGQVVSEGFIEWRTTPWKRRLITRLIGMVPSLVVSAAVGESGVNTLLVASQVTLSIVLPFVMFPLLWYTSSLKRMTIPRPLSEAAAAGPSDKTWLRMLQICNPFGRRSGPKGMVTFANNYFVVALGWAIFVVVVIADVYALVQLGRGEA